MNAVDILDFRTATLQTKAEDPLRGDLKWRNNDIAPGDLLLEGCLLGVYEPENNRILLWSLEYEGRTYVWGMAWFSDAPARGSEVTHPLWTYILRLPDGDWLCSVLSFISHYQNLNFLSIDFGYGDRIVAIEWAGVQTLPFIDTRLFADVLNVSQ